MSENKIFRKVSLDRLSSPEELDQRLTVVSPIGWVALVAVALLISAGFIWGFFGSIANKASGTGIIMSSGGISSIIHHANGQITDVSVEDGDYIKKGQVIARIDQTDLIAEINKNKEDLAAARAIDLDNIDLTDTPLNLNVYGKIAQIYKDYKVAQATVATQRTYYHTQKSQAENEMEQARVQYEADLEKYQNQKILYENGAVAKAELNNAERQLSISELSYKSKQQNFNQVPQSQLIEAETNLASLEQLLKETISLSIMDLEHNIGEEKEQTNALEAIVYVPVQQGKKIRPGMEVNISPTTVKKEEYGFMLGNVVSVSQYPASAQGMMLTLGNNDLVRQLSGEGAPIEVKVKLVMDSSTQSGYKWSTPNGAPLTIDDGTFCLGEVKVEEKRPVSMVIPFIKKILPM